MVLVSVLLLLAASMPAQERDYEAFMAALKCGADRPKLYALKKEVRPNSSVSEQADMTRRLRSAIIC